MVKNSGTASAVGGTRTPARMVEKVALRPR
jgi:hypothetical protein